MLLVCGFDDHKKNYKMEIIGERIINKTIIFICLFSSTFYTAISAEFS
jgi:hypothetical protein